MTSWRDFESEMQRLPLDTDTADRLLAGSVLPADAPPGYAGVALLVKTAAEGTVPADSQGATETLAVLVAAVRSRTDSRSPRRSSVHRLKLATAVVAAAFACTTGLALAEGLPGAAQDVASQMLAKVGVTVSGPNENAGTHPDVRGQSESDVSATEEHADLAGESQGKGAEVSELATTTELEGVEKGAAISTLASEGKSQAGQHGQATDEHGAATAATDAGSTEAPNAASGDHAAGGQSHRP
jgi:hypothetical protein